MAIETVSLTLAQARPMLRKRTLDQWGVLKKLTFYTKNDPEFQISSFRFALRSHQNLLLRRDSEKVRAHYGLMLYGLAAAGYLFHNGIGDYRLSQQGLIALDEYITAKRRHRHIILLGVIAACASVIALLR